MRGSFMYLRCIWFAIGLRGIPGRAIENYSLNANGFIYRNDLRLTSVTTLSRPRHNETLGTYLLRW